jgi:hypothetical protein
MNETTTERETALKEALETGRFIRVRPGGYQIQCVICEGRGYAWGKWYSDHLKDHTFPCTTCGIAYLSQRGINTHLQKSKAHATST